MKREELMKDMLDSIRRLNEECQSRVEFERKLIEIINEKDKQIESCRQYCLDKDKEYNNLEEEFDKLKEEAVSFRTQVEAMFLKEREMFIWENGVLKVMDTSY